MSKSRSRAGRLPRRGGYAPADSQACPQLELRVFGARSACHLVYRSFNPRGAGKVPDAKTMGRWALLSAAKSSSRFTKNGENRARNMSERTGRMR